MEQLQNTTAPPRAVTTALRQRFPAGGYKKSVVRGDETLWILSRLRFRSASTAFHYSPAYAVRVPAAQRARVGGWVVRGAGFRPRDERKSESPASVPP